MSDQNATPSRQGERWLDPGVTNMQVIYFLYLAGFVIGVTPLIGVVMAYINRGRSPSWIETHYTWAIRTFWIGLLYGLIGVILTFVLVGIVVLIAVAVWYVVRCIIGLQAISRGEPIKNPQHWIV